MNREDLIAWKHYDNNQYSMIPGVTSQKKIADRAKSENPNVDMSGSIRKGYDPRFHEKQDRMKQYGFTRDIRDLRSLSIDKTANTAS